MNSGHLIVVVCRVVVIEVKASYTGVYREVDGIHIARMSPAALTIVIVGRVLCVVNEYVYPLNSGNLGISLFRDHAFKQFMLVLLEFMYTLCD